MGKSQNDIVLEHLKKYRGITSFEAFSRYGITRLSGRIFDLRSRGYKIVGCDIESINRYGDKTKFTEYRLSKENAL